ncbi:MAG: PadR family transcriptional regulator [Chloroflexota bacterium]|nr:PadR family transcriptional regulator [Chloroflexota bacterium]
MTKENKSKYAVMGVLSICPGSGYDIKKFMEYSTSNFWSESYGQIYPILKQLVEEGLAASHAEKQEGKPEKYIYTLTEQGKEELRDWLSEPVASAVERNELLLKLFFGAHISLEKNKEHVHAFQELQSHLLEKYKGIERELLAEVQNDATLSYPLMTVRYGIYRCRALLAWCDETLGTLDHLAQRERTAPQEGQDAVEVKRSIPNGKDHSRTFYGTD